MRGAAGRAYHHVELAVLEHDGGRHRGERALARRHGVRLALHQPVVVGRSGLGREIVHLIVEQDAEPGGRYAAAVAAVQRVGHGDGVALRIDDRIMRGLRAFVARRVAGLDLRAGRGAVRDGLAQPRNVPRVEQAGDGHLHEIGIAEVLRAVGEVAPHGFGEEVHGGGRPGARFLVARAFEHAEHLQDADAARARRRRREDAVAAVLALERLALHYLVILQVGQRDQAAVAFHVRRQQPRRLAFVETPGAVAPDAFERARQFRLHQEFTRLVILAVALEDARGLGEAGQHAAAAQALRKPVGNRKAFGGQVHGGRHQLRPRPFAPLAVRQFEARHGAGHARGAVADHAVLGGLAGGVQVHIAGGAFGSAFAEIEESRAAVGETHQHEAAAAQVAGRGMRDGQRQTHGHRGIHGVSAGLERGHSGAGGVLLARDHHGAAGPHRSARSGVPRRRQQQKRGKPPQNGHKIRFYY